jgi:uncharacterized protein
MTSNGVYLKKYISFLVENDVEVGISLDGDSFGNAYRVTRNNKPSFDIVIRNLDYVRDNYPDYFEKNISFMSVMHNHNNFQSLFSFFKEKYDKIPSVSDINTINISEEYREEFYKTFFQDKQDDRNDPAVMKTYSLRHPRVKDMTDMVSRYSGMVFKNHYMMMAPARDITGKKKYMPTATCSPFSLRVYMTTDGTILPCEHISREFKIGQIGPDGISIDPAGISEMYNRYFKKIRTYCEKCYLADNCKECVFNTNISSEKPVCEFYMSERKFKGFLARHYSIIEQDYKFFTRVVKDAFTEQG